MSEIKTKLSASAQDTHAVHLEDKDAAAIAIWNLSVLIVPDENFWFAQGLEINYGAQGETVEDAQENFQQGLLATIEQHLRVHGHIKNLLKFAPSEILQEAAEHKTSIKKFAQVSFHEILDAKSQLEIPFDGIEYRVLRQAA
ncbi:MAG: hypothetical protein ABSH31_19955 [Bryobacteraceae bacterium]|jgi:predicted RNase H-like HicB family nuclease